MDKIFDRNPSKSEVIGRCGGNKKRMITQNRQKSNSKKKNFLLYWVVIHKQGQSFLIIFLPTESLGKGVVSPYKISKYCRLCQIQCLQDNAANVRSDDLYMYLQTLPKLLPASFFICISLHPSEKNALLCVKFGIHQAK